MKLVKCFFIGDGTVGKTSIILRYSLGVFKNYYLPTVLETTCFNVFVKNEKIELWVCDVIEQDDYMNRLPMLYNGIDLFVVCYSVVDVNSFEHVVTKWKSNIEYYSPNTPLMLLGTKIDLREENKKVVKPIQNKVNWISTEQGINKAKEIKAVLFMECSSLTGFNITTLFQNIAKVAKPQTVFSKTNGYCFIF
ncbi:Rho GTPase, putative [Entamoeba invadens IP1]|uniref:small monomeric GTPase n=1 Tax=Entamoeba invadens IP1 TaxID=370355 RepID=A0A0A1TZ22_ENTIV|nr:Rho GTPase, putative [Entamoeba invadens IP1]ELP84970.1 Rho GTPase, putative [Entamoeba invadens IP1]|eukprot:XP_004184316.1 Rho GTPase, putative [Entamoeba invadens IP1]